MGKKLLIIMVNEVEIKSIFFIAEKKRNFSLFDLIFAGLQNKCLLEMFSVDENELLIRISNRYLYLDIIIKSLQNECWIKNCCTILRNLI